MSQYRPRGSKTAIIDAVPAAAWVGHSGNMCCRPPRGNALSTSAYLDTLNQMQQINNQFLKPLYHITAADNSPEDASPVETIGPKGLDFSPRLDPYLS